MNQIKSASTWIIAILVPFLLLLTSIRILINPWYLDYQYHKSDFPADIYGFTQEDRLHWGKISLDYLVNSADQSFLGNLKLPNGSPLYNSRELSHMVDVKNVVQGALFAWYILGGLFILGGIAAWKFGWKAALVRGLSRGGWITLGLIATILIFLAINFDALFTTFHALFFEGDTWRFDYSDTLIRLFPLPLWEEAFIWVGILTIVMALILAIGLGRIHRKIRTE